MRLSLIIPCYNSHQYLRECLDSIYAQDISEDQFEVIAVNDCSTDNTREILLEYQNHHSNLILIDHEYNRGQGAARNTGLLYANGEYIWYIDHDDFVHPNSFFYLLNSIAENPLDFLQFNYDQVDMNNEFKQEIILGKEETGIINGIEFVRSLGKSFLSQYNISVWSRIYNRKFLLNGHFQFEEIRIFEDLEYSLKTLMFANKIKVINKSPYCYRIHSRSTMEISKQIIRGDFTFFSFRSGLSILNLGRDISTKDAEISKILIEGGVWRMNSITKPIIYCTAKERRIFFSLLKENIRNEYSLLTLVNRGILKNSILCTLVLFIISPLLRILRKLKLEFTDDL